MTSELLILGLDLVKTRTEVMGVEMRKTFVIVILVALIEATTDIKVMKAIVKVFILTFFYFIAIILRHPCLDSRRMDEKRFSIPKFARKENFANQTDAVRRETFPRRR